MAEDATLVPAYAGKVPLPLASEAARLAEILPHLSIEARHVAAQLQLGIHGRRRPGPGEEFWEFRPFIAGESAARIDWRRSARDDRLYIREREWESASAYWLWFDLSPSMLFASRQAERPKRDRALLIGLALADLLVHAGERVGLLGETTPMASRSIISRLADALMRARRSDLPDDAMPVDRPLKRRDHLVLIGDFIMPLDAFSARLAVLAQNGNAGTLVLIRDPAEENFPFTGELEFSGVESDETWRIGDALEIAARYRERIGAINAEMRRIALSHGFGFVKHVTDRPAAETLMHLAALIGGQMPASASRPSQHGGA